MQTIRNGELIVMIRIIIADDHKIIRDGLTSLLDADDDIEVIAQTADGYATVEAAREFLPNVVIMEIAMPGAAVRF